MAEERVQRRLAAILAADVVGYSRLVGADESGTLSAFKNHLTQLIEPSITHNRGRIVKTMGDGVLAEFGSAVDAVLCARAVQEGMIERNTDVAEDHRLRFRIGINVGDIVIDGDDIQGDGVNIAARLEGIAEPDGICISGTVYDQVHGKLDADFADLGEQEVKNIALPIRAYRVTDTGDAANLTTHKTATRNISAIAAAVALLVAVAIGLTWWEPWVTRVDPASVERMAFKLPDKPSLAVLPFNDFSEKRDQEFFADGLTEEIISRLASFENIFVIARNSANKFKGKPVDVREVAEDLGVRYVLEGSIRRAGNDIRVTAQLIDAINGRHIWAGKFDRQMKDIFALQDEITGEIASRLVSKVEMAEFKGRSRKLTRDPKAYEFFLLGWNHFAQTSPKANARAIKLFEQAIEIDPKYARAHSYLAYARRHNAVFGWGKEAKDTMDHALELAKKAVALDPEDSLTHEYLAQILGNYGDLKPTIEEFEKAIALSPGNPDPLVGYSIALALAGRDKDAVKNIEMALRLNPYARVNYFARAGITYYMAREFEKSAAVMEQARRLHPGAKSFARAIRAAAYAKLGKIDEARRAREDYLKANPKYSIQAHLRRLNYPAEPRRLLEDGLKKAGYSEHPPLKLPDKPSVAVLPFANMSDDKQQEYFSDGITEDIITDLSKVSGLFVIARTSTNRYKGKSADIRKIARELGVRYIVEGSVRKAAGRVRITVQLIEAATGNHLWAERYDRELKDMFAIQDDVAEQVVAKLATRIGATAKRRVPRKYLPNPQAHDLTVRGYFTYAPPTPRNLAAAKSLFEQAISLDPGYARPYAGLAEVYGLSLVTGNSKARKADAGRVVRMARKAIALDDGLAVPYVSLGRLSVMRGNFDKGIEYLERAVLIDPGYARGQVFYGYYLARAGRLKEALAPTEKALRLAPYTPAVHSFAAVTYFWLGKYEKSVAHFRRRESIQGRSTVARETVRAAAEVMAGKMADARETIRLVLRQRTDFTMKDGMRAHRSKDPRANALLADAMRRAGLPEGEPPKLNAPPLSIVVLPFDNLSDDKSQGYFADGITEDLITDLSRIKGMFVIARGTSFTYKSKAVKAKDVAKELNVRYVLEGSVRRSGDQVRVNAQLINGETGAHIWSDRFDREIKDVFSLQNDVTGRIAAVLKGEFLEAESRQVQRGGPANLSAWETGLRGYVKAFSNPRGTAFGETKALLERAVAMDPKLAIGWIGLARIYYLASTSGRPGISRPEARKKMIETAQRAVSLDPKNSDAHTLLGYAYRFNRQNAPALAACERAIAINPNDDEAYVCAAMAKVGVGRTAEAFPLFEKSHRLNPMRTPYVRLFQLGLAHLMAGQHEKSETALRKAIADNPRFPSPYYVLASTLAHLGRLDEARTTLATFLRLDRGGRDTIEKFHKRVGYVSPNFGHLLEGLRRAGMPEK